MKKRKLLNWLAAVLVVTFAVMTAITPPAAAQNCSTFSSPCYFFIEEDICKTWSCTYCNTMQCCHVQSGSCLSPSVGYGYLQYCDQYCSGGKTRG